jgi:hypothetical protein
MHGNNLGLSTAFLRGAAITAILLVRFGLARAHWVASALLGALLANLGTSLSAPLASSLSTSLGAFLGAFLCPCWRCLRARMPPVVAFIAGDRLWDLTLMGCLFLALARGVWRRIDWLRGSGWGYRPRYLLPLCLWDRWVPLILWG